jgi:hypothetical protein
MTLGPRMTALPSMQLVDPEYEARAWADGAVMVATQVSLPPRILEDDALKPEEVYACGRRRIGRSSQRVLIAPNRGELRHTCACAVTRAKR